MNQQIEVDTGMVTVRASPSRNLRSVPAGRLTVLLASSTTTELVSLDKLQKLCLEHGQEGAQFLRVNVCPVFRTAPEPAGFKSLTRAIIISS